MADQLELLKLRDQLFALAAEEAERKFRYSRLRDQVEKLNMQFIEQTDLLRTNMTRAYVAESQAIQLQLKIDAVSQQHHDELVSIRSSLTWRVGRLVLAPARWCRPRKRK